MSKFGLKVEFSEIEIGGEFVSNGLKFVKIDDDNSLSITGRYYDSELEEDVEGEWHPNAFCIGVHDDSRQYEPQVYAFAENDMVRPL